MIWQKIQSLFAKNEPEENPFKDEWTDLLVANVPLYSKLPGELKLRLHDRIAAFVASTRFEGCNGLGASGSDGTERRCSRGANACFFAWID